MEKSICWNGFRPISWLGFGDVHKLREWVFLRILTPPSSLCEPFYCIRVIYIVVWTFPQPPSPFAIHAFPKPKKLKLVNQSITNEGHEYDVVSTYDDAETLVESNIKYKYGELRLDKSGDRYYRFYGPVLPRPLIGFPEIGSLSKQAILNALWCSKVCISLFS